MEGALKSLYLGRNGSCPCWCPEVFSSKDQKNGLELLKDGLDKPKDGVVTLIHGQIQ